MQTSRLFDAAKHKDIEAYNCLVSEHQDLVYNIAYYVLCDEASAEKATQQAFLQAFHKLDKYRGGSIRFWFLKNLVDICQKISKRDHKPYKLRKQPGKTEFPFGFLPTDLRLALVLVELEGMNYELAAGLIGASPGKVAQLLTIARHQLTLNYPV